jgi:hypothetical protein
MIAKGWVILWVIINEEGLDIRTFAVDKGMAIEKWLKDVEPANTLDGHVTVDRLLHNENACAVRVKVEVIDSEIRQWLTKDSCADRGAR